MAVNFSSTDPSAIGFFAPTRFEADVFDCEVEGKIPTELNGAFYRVAPTWFYPPLYKDDALPFGGDGYVSMFRFSNGTVDYKGRFVETERYLADKKARRQLFGRYRSPASDDPLAKGVNRTVANTSMYTHAGRLWALKEDNLPIEMDPNTLETRGEWNFYGKVGSKTFTAHPKTDPLTGDLYCYGYEAAGDLTNDIFYYIIDKSGHVKHEVRFKAPIISMMHDMVLTQKHVIFNTCGFTTNAQRLKEGKTHWAWDSTVPTYIAILPRDGDAKDVRWFKGPQSAAIHLMNGNTKGNKVVIEAPISDGNPFPFFSSMDGSPFVPQKARTVLRRWTFDLGSKKDSWEEETLFPNTPGALTRVDERYLSLPYRYGYVNYTDPSRPFDEKKAGNLRGRVSNCYARFDLHTGKVDSYFAGDVSSLQEVQFVPRKKDAPEGDGFLIGVASNLAEMHSELVIVDAMRMEEGDIARVKLPFRLTSQVHGWWAGIDDLPFQPMFGVKTNV